MSSPQHKLGVVKDPMRVLIEEAVVFQVGLARSDWVLLLETFNNFPNLVVKTELYSACH